MRAHVPAQVAAVLEHLAAGAALVHPPVLPQLPDQLPPDAVPAGEDQTPLECDAAALMMGEPGRGDRRTVTPGALGCWGQGFKAPATLERALPHRPGLMGEGRVRLRNPPEARASRGRGAWDTRRCRKLSLHQPHALESLTTAPREPQAQSALRLTWPHLHGFPHCCPLPLGLTFSMSSSCEPRKPSGHSDRL